MGCPGEQEEGYLHRRGWRCRPHAWLIWLDGHASFTTRDPKDTEARILRRPRHVKRARKLRLREKDPDANRAGRPILWYRGVPRPLMPASSERFHYRQALQAYLQRTAGGGRRSHLWPSASAKLATRCARRKLQGERNGSVKALANDAPTPTAFSNLHVMNARGGRGAPWPRLDRPRLLPRSIVSDLNATLSHLLPGLSARESSGGTQPRGK